MEERIPTSVFKTICWTVLIFIVSGICVYLIYFIILFIVGLLQKYVSFINTILSIKWIYFIFLTLTTADIGRRSAIIMLAVFKNALAKSQNVSNGFIGAGVFSIILLVIYIITAIATKNLAFLDLSMGTCGIFFIISGVALSKEDDDTSIQETQEVQKVPAPVMEPPKSTYEQTIEIYNRYNRGEITAAEKDYLLMTLKQ